MVFGLKNSTFTFMATSWLVEIFLALNTFPNAPWPTKGPNSKSFIQITSSTNQINRKNRVQFIDF